MRVNISFYISFLPNIINVTIIYLKKKKNKLKLPAHACRKQKNKLKVNCTQDCTISIEYKFPIIIISCIIFYSISVASFTAFFARSTMYNNDSYKTCWRNCNKIQSTENSNKVPFHHHSFLIFSRNNNFVASLV